MIFVVVSRHTKCAGGHCAFNHRTHASGPGSAYHTQQACSGLGPDVGPAPWRPGLSALNISLDTLRPERFEAMTRRRGHERVMGAIEHALRLGFDPVKVASPCCASASLL